MRLIKIIGDSWCGCFNGDNIELNPKERLILALLHKQSYTIEDVSKKLGVHRITASKYLAVLEAKKLITHREIGKAKLYSVRESKHGKE